jgi:type I restriction enzyme S subunit
LELTETRKLSENAAMHLGDARRAIIKCRQSVLAAAYSGRLTQDWRDAHPEQDMDIGQLEMERRAAFGRLGNSKRYSEPVPHDARDLPDIPETWRWVSADAVSSQITDGEHIQPPYEATGFPMLSAKHVRNGFVDPTGAGVIAANAFEQARKRCAPAKGDLLVVSVGATTGRTAIVQIEEPFAIVRSVLLLKPLLQPRYLLNWLQSQWAFDWMRQASGASAQPHLYIRDLRRLPVPMPPLAERAEIVRVVDTTMAKSDSVEQRLRLVMARLDRVSHAVLAAALGNGYQRVDDNRFGCG